MCSRIFLPLTIVLIMIFCIEGEVKKTCKTVSGPVTTPTLFNISCDTDMLISGINGVFGLASGNCSVNKNDTRICPPVNVTKQLEFCEDKQECTANITVLPQNLKNCQQALPAVDISYTCINAYTTYHHVPPVTDHAFSTSLVDPGTSIKSTFITSAAVTYTRAPSTAVTSTKVSSTFSTPVTDHEHSTSTVYPGTSTNSSFINPTTVRAAEESSKGISTTRSSVLILTNVSYSLNSSVTASATPATATVLSTLHRSTTGTTQSASSSTSTKSIGGNKDRVVIITLSAIIGVLMIMVTLVVIFMCRRRHMNKDNKTRVTPVHHISEIRLSRIENPYQPNPSSPNEESTINHIHNGNKEEIAASDSLYWEIGQQDGDVDQGNQNVVSTCDGLDLKTSEKQTTLSKGLDSEYTEVNLEDGAPLTKWIGDSVTTGRRSKQLKTYYNEPDGNDFTDGNVWVKPPVTVVQIGENSDTMATDKDNEFAKDASHSLNFKSKDNYDRIILNQLDLEIDGSKNTTTEIRNRGSEKSDNCEILSEEMLAKDYSTIYDYETEVGEESQVDDTNPSCESMSTGNQLNHDYFTLESVPDGSKDTASEIRIQGNAKSGDCEILSEKMLAKDDSTNHDNDREVQEESKEEDTNPSCESTPTVLSYTENPYQQNPSSLNKESTINQIHNRNKEEIAASDSFYWEIGLPDDDDDDQGNQNFDSTCDGRENSKTKTTSSMDFDSEYTEVNLEDRVPPTQWIGDGDPIEGGSKQLKTYYNESDGSDFTDGNIWVKPSVTVVRIGENSDTMATDKNNEFAMDASHSLNFKSKDNYDRIVLNQLDLEIDGSKHTTSEIRNRGSDKSDDCEILSEEVLAKDDQTDHDDETEVEEESKVDDRNPSCESTSTGNQLNHDYFTLESVPKQDENQEHLTDDTNVEMPNELKSDFVIIPIETEGSDHCVQNIDSRGQTSCTEYPVSDDGYHTLNLTWKRSTQSDLVDCNTDHNKANVFGDVLEDDNHLSVKL